MELLFLNILNRSITAGWLILAVMVLRHFMKRAPRWMSCILWGIVAVRLLCPFLLESPMSLIPSRQLLSPYTVRYARRPSITSGIPELNAVVNPSFSHVFAPTPTASINPLQFWMYAAGILWLLGFLALLFSALISCLRLRKIVEESIPLKKDIRLCDHIGSPFILGIFRPGIYLPSTIGEEELFYVLAHEKAHIKRRDHWWKPLGYLLLSVYWFHPLVWAAYVLFCRDIELACDEKVIRDMNLDEKKAYSQTLVSFSIQRRLVNACPLAFGENNVKERVNKILHYKKPTFWIIAGALAVCMAAAVCFLTNPPEKTDIIKEETSPAPSMIPYAGRWYPREALTEDTITWLEWYNLLPQEEQLAIDFVPWDLYELSGLGDGSDQAVTLETDQEKEGETAKETLPPLDQAIYDAVMEKKKGSYLPDFDFACCDFLMLEMTSAASPENSAAETIICYGWVLYMQYLVSEKGLEDRGGCHIPTVLTFYKDQGSYILKEYWEPRNGSYYVPDIEKKFPTHLVRDGIDSQKYIIRQQQSCYSQAVQATGLDTDAVIGRLFQDLCSGPGLSFDPQTIPGQQNSEYLELKKYGQYTVSYCLSQFEQGGQTGVKGRIMALVCEEILQTKGTLPHDAAEADTGQFWYEGLLASSRMIPLVSEID